MSERCPRCENDRFGAMVRNLQAAYRRDLAQLLEQGVSHSCLPIYAPEPPLRPLSLGPEPTPPHPDPALAPVPKKQRDFDWMP